MLKESIRKALSHVRSWSRTELQAGAVGYIGEGAGWRFVVVGWKTAAVEFHDGTASHGATVIRMPRDLAREVYEAAHAAGGTS